MQARTHTRSRLVGQVGRYELRCGASVPRLLARCPLLLPALLLAGCVTGAQVQREPKFSPRGGCQAELVMRELLERYPGVQVSSERGGVRVRIRGATQEPLYVLDGQPLAQISDGLFSALHPCDIHEIRVLTDAADLTFYGLRGGNGVILITTRVRGWRTHKT